MQETGLSDMLSLNCMMLIKEKKQSLIDFASEFMNKKMTMFFATESVLKDHSAVDVAIKKLIASIKAKHKHY